MDSRRRLIFFTCSTFLLIACMVVVLVVNLVTRGASANTQTADRRIVYGLTFLPSGFDPHINASSELTIPLRSVYDTLVYRERTTGEFVSGLAERWEISSDRLTYTFYLRSGVFFHDGTAFDAAAVAATLDRITDPETRSQKAIFLLGPYAGHEIVDPLTIRLRLHSPWAPLLDSLSQTYTGIASPTALQAYDRDRYQLHQVGTGPFVMVDYIPGDFMLLRRNPNYTWGPSLYMATSPYAVEEIEFRFFTDAATRAPALESGAAHVMGEIAPTDALVLVRDPQIVIRPQPIPGLPLQFFFNTARTPTDDLEVRQALIMATNRLGIIDAVFQQFSPPAFGPLARATRFYEPRVSVFYEHDAPAARRMLAGEGYSDTDADGLLDRGGEPLRLTMIVPSWGFVPQVAQQIQAQWRALGIALDLQQAPNLASLRAAVQEGAYHLVAFTDFGADASLLNTFYTTGAPNNFSQFASGDLDNWLNQAAQSVLDDERASYYSLAQGLIMDRALILPIRDYVNINASNTRVGDLSFDATGWAPLLWNLTLDAPPPTPDIVRT